MEEVDAARIMLKGPETDVVVMAAKLVKEAQDEALSRCKAIEKDRAKNAAIEKEQLQQN